MCVVRLLLSLLVVLALTTATSAIAAVPAATCVAEHNAAAKPCCNMYGAGDCCTAVKTTSLASSRPDCDCQMQAEDSATTVALGTVVHPPVLDHASAWISLTIACRIAQNAARPYRGPPNLRGPDGKVFILYRTLLL
jgi:hypothetical protein